MVPLFSPSYPCRAEKKALDVLIYRNPDVIEAAKNLLGKFLFTKVKGLLTGGIIIETEAYAGVEDKASHAYGGRRTKRTEVLYRAGGVAYVYLCYGIHSMLNVVTGSRGVPPTHGIEIMMQRRNKARIDATLAGGPGSLCAAMGIDLSYNGLLFGSESLWIQDGKYSIASIEASARIGIDYAEEWAALPYRFVAK